MQKHVRASAAFCIKLSCVEHQASTYSTSPHGAGLDTGGGDNDLKQHYFQSGIWTAATLGCGCAVKGDIGARGKQWKLRAVGVSFLQTEAR